MSEYGEVRMLLGIRGRKKSPGGRWIIFEWEFRGLQLGVGLIGVYAFADMNDGSTFR